MQHQRGGSAIDLHIPESGPLTPEAVAASLDEARAFFPPLSRRAIHGFRLRLLATRPAAAGIPARGLQHRPVPRRFELEPYDEQEGPDADVEVLRFAFRSLTTPLDELPRGSVLQRAIVDHLKAGRHWQWRRGRFPI